MTTTYNGWANYETWNVSLWLQNDEAMYSMAHRRDSYEELLPMLEMAFSSTTPDGVYWSDEAIDIDELNKMLQEL